MLAAWLEIDEKTSKPLTLFFPPIVLCSTVIIEPSFTFGFFQPENGKELPFG